MCISPFAIPKSKILLSADQVTWHNCIPFRSFPQILFPTTKQSYGYCKLRAVVLQPCFGILISLKISHIPHSTHAAIRFIWSINIYWHLYMPNTTETLQTAALWNFLPSLLNSQAGRVSLAHNYEITRLLWEIQDLQKQFFHQPLRSHPSLSFCPQICSTIPLTLPVRSPWPPVAEANWLWVLLYAFSVCLGQALWESLLPRDLGTPLSPRLLLQCLVWNPFFSSSKAIP